MERMLFVGILRGHQELQPNSASSMGSSPENRTRAFILRASSRVRLLPHRGLYFMPALLGGRKGTLSE
jgi:hypothetical protein